MNARLYFRSRLGRSQRGVTLIVALVFLAILALLGVTVAKTTSLEERMSSNTRDRDLAFQAAEAALRQAQNNLATLAAGAPSLDTTAANDAAYWNAYDWSTATSVATSLNGLAAQPQYLVQRRGTSDNYRVTSRGVGANSVTVVILQAEYDITP
jgi:type IV pilus assembly protein PilX